MLSWEELVPGLHLSPYCCQRTVEETINYSTLQQQNSKASRPC